MLQLADNIRYLRMQRGLSQQKMADLLDITRARYSKWEEAAAEPPLEILISISKFFHVSIDLMLSVDLRRVPLADVLKMEDNRIMLPVQVNTEGEKLIEIVPHKAKAGYLTNYSDPEYIQGLATISLPFLRNGMYRGFPIEGDSMLPLPDGSWVIGKYIERMEDINYGRSYIVITLNEGIVYKRLERLNDSELILYSDNGLYESYTVSTGEILELWEFACCISTKEFERGDAPLTVNEMFNVLRNDIKGLSAKIR